MKRLLILLSVIILLCSSGCSFPESHPIEDIQRILVAGIDMEGEYFVLTVLVDTIAGAKPGEEKVSYKLYTAKGKTVFEAKRAMHTFVEKRITWYHTKYVLIGEEAAKTDIDQLLSFFVEDDETRLLYKVAVTKGTAAKDFLKNSVTLKGGLAEYLDALFDEQGRTGKTREIHLINYAAYMEIPWVSVYIPTIEQYLNPVGESSQGGGGSEGGSEGGGGGSASQEYLVNVEGFAVFDKDKLAGYLDGSMARGLNFLNNDISSTMVSVKDPESNNVALELMNSDTKVTPDLDNLSVDIEVNLESNLVEFTTASPLKEQDMHFIEHQQSEIICNEIAQTVSYLQQIGCDPAFIMDKFYHKDPVKWQGMKDDWKSIFKNLKVNVKVNTKILATYDFSEAIGKGGG